MDDDLDEIFALPPSEFTAARNALAKRLREEKRREEADAVKALRRPPLSAWAVNQVARRHPEAVERLVRAGRELAAAQRRALSGVRDSGMREAARERRERIEEAWSLASAVLADGGADPGPYRQRISDTLAAASVDEEAAEAVRRGRLTADLAAPTGMGEVAGLTLVAVAEPETAPDSAPELQDPDETRRAALTQAREEARRAEQQAANLESRAGDARQSALRATEEAERLERRLQQVQQRARELTTAAEQAEQQAQQAREEADAAVARARQLTT